MDGDSTTANKFTTVIMSTVIACVGVIDVDISEKMLCFRADGVNTFQGLETGVTIQIKEKFAPFATGVHCCAHCLNLATQFLSSLTVMHAVEEVFCSTHTYFTHSLKKVAEFKALSQQLESKGLKLLKNVKTQWISCPSSMRRLLAKYKGVQTMMHKDKNDKKWRRKARVSTPFLLYSFVHFHFCILRI